MRGLPRASGCSGSSSLGTGAVRLARPVHCTSGCRGSMCNEEHLSLHVGEAPPGTVKGCPVLSVPLRVGNGPLGVGSWDDHMEPESEKLPVTAVERGRDEAIDVAQILLLRV